MILYMRRGTQEERYTTIKSNSIYQCFYFFVICQNLIIKKHMNKNSTGEYTVDNNTTRPPPTTTRGQLLAEV